MAEENAMSKPNRKPELSNKNNSVAKKVADENKRQDTQFEATKKKLIEATDKKAERQANELMEIMQDVPRKVLEQLGVNVEGQNNPEFFRETLDTIIDSIV